jgi:hypothetical protein
VSQAQYLHEQAAVARQMAETAKLQNVRSRYLQSAAIWAQLAERAERLEQMQSAPCDARW